MDRRRRRRRYNRWRLLTPSYLDQPWRLSFRGRRFGRSVVSWPLGALSSPLRRRQSEPALQSNALLLRPEPLSRPVFPISVPHHGSFQICRKGGPGLYEVGGKPGPRGNAPTLTYAALPPVYLSIQSSPQLVS